MDKELIDALDIIEKHGKDYLRVAKNSIGTMLNGRIFTESDYLLVEDVMELVQSMLPRQRKHAMSDNFSSNKLVRLETIKLAESCRNASVAMLVGID